MRFWVGVTDNGWFDYLSRAGVDEVNFWQPSGKPAFTTLESGAPFLFKLKRPFNHIAGGGIFVKFSVLPLSMAWETFGNENGANSFEQFETMIRKLAPNLAFRNPEVGCTVLAEPFFWPKSAWIPDPPGWAGSIMRGRYYDTRQHDGDELWSNVQARLAHTTEVASTPIFEEPKNRYGDPVLIAPRLGQGAFRVLVTDAYKRRCAITGENTLPVLEAAHILPFSESGPNRVSNGLLLRSDFHKLFDLGFVTITPDLKIEVSTRIREEWFNGKAYYRLHGEALANIPDTPAFHPDREFLRWHNDRRFQS